ncbi:MAG: DUF1905 domain-containing protein [Saprospiraceae bacterium]|nr:DUF1905 domain-containing protein [Saprospiraceae bacterium]
MIFKGVKYEFSVLPWQFSGKGAWIFVTLPAVLSKEIRDNFRSEEEGWGRLKATAQIGQSEWNTAIWYDSKSEAYLLALKAEIRKKENIEVDKTVQVILWI